MQKKLTKKCILFSRKTKPKIFFSIFSNLFNTNGHGKLSSRIKLSFISEVIIAKSK